ncbi:hypothetical protein [Haladaptatus salinisoli]|uniref:hypothetical protein n=1 Tax=Haladaptatus salinisoli TaxID=2884876 RepID=UPI001D0B9979|nr:hypothetical protein [Haladaptatus salinisoli]
MALLSTVFAGGALAQDGGDAVAIQTNDQSNSNAQTGIAIAENTAEDIEQENELDDSIPVPPPPQPSDPGET